MKSRVIIKHGEYVPQVKLCWWTYWRNLYEDEFYKIQDVCISCSTMDEAVEILKEFELDIQRQKEESKLKYIQDKELCKNDGTVVWKNY
jgi:hypothetical protein